MRALIRVLTVAFVWLAILLLSWWPSYVLFGSAKISISVSVRSNCHHSQVAWLPQVAKIAEVTRSNPAQPWFFFQSYFFSHIFIPVSSGERKWACKLLSLGISLCAVVLTLSISCFVQILPLPFYSAIYRDSHNNNKRWSEVARSFPDGPSLN